MSWNGPISCSSTSFVTLWTSSPELIEEAKFVALTSNHVLAKQEGVTSAHGTVKLQSFVTNPLNNEQLPVYVTKDIEFADETDSFIGKLVIFGKRSLNVFFRDSCGMRPSVPICLGAPNPIQPSTA